MRHQAVEQPTAPAPRPLMVDTWRRWAWIWTAIFVISLAVPLGYLMWRRPAPVGGTWATTILLVLLLFGWHLIGLRQRGRDSDWRNHQWQGVLYIAVGILLWYLLIQQDPIFYLTLTALFALIFYTLTPRWAVPVSILLFLLAMWGSGWRDLHWNDPALLSPLAGLASALLLYLWISAIIRQSAERKALIHQLEAAQAELGQAERTAGALAERQRLARDIHDTLAQGFVSVVMHLEAAEQAMPAHATLSKHHLHQAKRSARQSLAAARAVVDELRLFPESDSPLPKIVQQVATQWQEATGIAVAVAVTGAVRPLHTEREVTLLRAVQETLSNVYKHAQATAVTITLSYMDDEVVLDVQDDGVGIDGQKPHRDRLLSGNYGLTAMRERVEQLNGTLLIESAPQEGTTIVINLPMGPREP
ncbi:MAG: sensor histidine kinase [Anaerolineales bacterium]|nr:sensor histidine kinase [Anaerolineales bacterium]MCB9128073.1 sensor histidine kinase [Ardenticatenales bacterium]